MNAAATARRPAAFSKLGAFALVAGGAALFLAMLWLIGADADFAGERGSGQAHVSSNGLNGYTGLARLAEAQGYSVERSRNAADLETYGVLVITPDFFGDGKEVGEIINKRRFRGPTLVIMPKWWTNTPGPNLPPEDRAKFKKGWVTLSGAEPTEWPDVLPTGYTFKHKVFPEPVKPVVEMVKDPKTGQRQARLKEQPKPAPPPPPARWSGMGFSGVLPTSSMLYAIPPKDHEALITDAKGRVLAFGIGLGSDEAPTSDDEAEAEADIYNERIQPVIFLADPDLANNYGLADPQRAAAALALIDELAATDDIDAVVFDLTLAGFGASENLLTLAFRPPFLAATLCLLVALVIVGWRAFQRFGPAAAAAGPDIAFGKRQPIANGASLILRARRFGLLGAPYAPLAARRLAERLGRARHDAQAIDAALAKRLPNEEPFTNRAARLEAATRPADILAAAQSLDELSSKLQQGQSSA
ncbi:MAG: DUF4350 domain-containing protein [Porphyrobacter sp.]|nr:DUF4350 domain-containing protein [Porphyrobacter sp.]